MRFSFCEVIIAPKMELVNTFLQKKSKIFSNFGIFLEKPLYKAEKTWYNYSEIGSAAVFIRRARVCTNER